MFRTMIIFIYSVRLTLEVHISPNMYLIASIIFVGKNIFSFLSYLALWLKSIVHTNVDIFLFLWFVLMSMTSAINYCGFIVNIEMREHESANSVLIVSNCIGYSGFFSFLQKFWNCFIYKNVCWYIFEIALNL